MLPALAAVVIAIAISVVVATPSARAGVAICDVTATSTSVPFGDQVTVTGTGFAPNTPITVTPLPPNPPSGVLGGLTDATGTFAFTFTPNQVGNWLVTFSQESGCSDSITITVTWDQICDVTTTSTSVPVGEQVTVTGAGFFPNAPIIVNLQTPGPSGVVGGTTDGTGMFVFTFTADQVGNYLVSFSQAGQENGCSDSVTIAAGAAGASSTPAPSGTGLPDAAMSEAESAPGWALLVTLLLWIAFVLAAATARGSRPA